MKKFLLGMLVMSVAFSFWYKINASTSDLTSPIFKIHAYSYDKLSDIYTFEQYGSAVLVANNILLTNAHVVTDSNNAVTLQYEACQTMSEDEVPVCFSTLQLLRYDKKNDLALLQIVNPHNDMPAYVNIGSGTLAMGASVRVVGYPANGGTTITTTQGTIAWFEDGYYKTDANIDEGNSWGGAFNAAGEFIGIPTFVVNGQTTLGYIIPTSVIADFIAGKSWATHKPKYSLAFDKRLKSIYVMQDSWIIDNTLFTTPDFNEIGLVLDNGLEKKANNLYHYTLYNEHDSVVMLSSFIATNDAAMGAYANNVVKYLSKNQYSPKKTTKMMGGKKWNVISFGDETLIGYYYIQASSTTKTYLEFVVFADKDNIADLTDLTRFVEGITLKRNQVKAKVFNLPVVKLSSAWDIGIVKWLEDDGLSISIFPKNGKYATEISAYIGEKWDTLKTITNQVRDTYDMIGYTVKNEISKYPNSVSIVSATSEDENPIVSVFGLKKYGSNNMFIHINSELTSSSAKQEAIQLAYKILGLQ